VNSPRVVSVAPGSPAARSGLVVGDELVSVNGEVPRDILRYRLLVDDALVDLDVRRGGLEQRVVVTKREGEPLGAEIDSAVFDRVVTCDNHCPFCFIHQLPKGMRKSLYLKDDDYRLSFLYGNFTTLTRFTEADLERVLTEGLSPLYVSIHATDPDVRARLLRNRRGAISLRWLRVLLDHGIEVHGQIVVCPGVNDEAVLEDTLVDLLDQYPELATVACVPLGVSAHNTEPDMRPHTLDEAVSVVEAVDRWQPVFQATVGRRYVHAADEYHLMAGRPFPEAEAYEDFAQHENGVGMARRLQLEVHAALAGDVSAEAGDVGTGTRAGFFSWVDGAPADGYRAPREPAADRGGGSVAVALRPSRRGSGDRPVRILTGEYGARVLAPLVPALAEHAGVEVQAVPVANDFFGGNIAVTGLLTGGDVAKAMTAAAGAGTSDWRWLLPDVVLSRGVFLDGTTLDDLPVPVEVVRTDGVSLVGALR
jgi:putative radical SAM enzyme (TIGR03279 family)